MLLEVESLDVRYGRTHAVKSLSLGVSADEIVTVLGSNGAGKTSLLRAVQGLTPTAGGRVVFAGEDLTRLSPPQRLRRGLALVPEGRQIAISLSVHENLLMGFQISLMLPSAFGCFVWVIAAAGRPAPKMGAIVALAVCLWMLPLCGGHGLTQVPALTAWLREKVTTPAAWLHVPLKGALIVQLW